ncbi:MAG: COR domain-containing protein [Elainellaceae cyanobacterium]
MTRDELLQLIDRAYEEGWEKLDLAGNDLEELPPEIGHLTNLQRLDLSSNSLSSLPAEIGQLTNLQALDLSSNSLSSLPPEIGQLTNLQRLDLSSNSLSSLPAEIGQLTNLQTLKLSSNSLSSLPAEIGQLTNLRSLFLGSNQLSHLPAEFTNLNQLEELDLGLYAGVYSVGNGNQFSRVPTEILRLGNLEKLYLDCNLLNTLPPEIGQLTNLQELDLQYNSLSSLPPEIGQLTNLQELDLSSNSLSSVSSQIGQLTNLKELNLFGNSLSSLPPEIGQLTNLQELDLRYNSLSSLPAEISQLASLQSLGLGDNSLSTLPTEISQLFGLIRLDVSRNLLSDFPESLVRLNRLRELGLAANQITSVPKDIGKLATLEKLSLGIRGLVINNSWSSYYRGNSLNSFPLELCQLKNLSWLDLAKNQLNSLPAEIVQLTNLKSLYLTSNSLSRLPIEITQLRELEEIDLRGNPVPIPPEILGPKEWYKDPGDIQAILDFYFQVQDPQETEPLYEAKLLIIGEGGAGKTSLSKKIQDENYELKPEEESTEGIEVIRWSFPLIDGQEFRVNIWDFGGQEIYHATHQFFLTKRSLYALVADTRQENTDFYYWLNVVELLSDNSPVVIIKNEKQDRQCPVNERQLRGEFTNLEKVLATNLQTNRGLAEIKDAIQQYIAHLPHIGTPLPKIWVRVRSALENYARHCNYISDEKFFELCQLNGFTDRQHMLNLSSYLHDLGVCLHFQDDDLLKKTVILKPEWGTTAVYEVLDTPSVKANYGKFTRDDLTQIWSEGDDADMRGELLHLMMRFKLCYEIRDLPNHYIAPQLLEIEKPEYDWDDSHNLILRYDYDFMPKGILTRFIVEMHQQIEQPTPEQSLVWKEGVILNSGRARAEVIEYYHKGEIHIRISGRDQKGLLSVIDHEFEKIHRSYERLKYKTLVPCNCSSCKGRQTPHFFPLQILQKFLDDRQDQIQCQVSYEMVRVRGLIDDVNLQNFETLHYQVKPSTPPKPVTRNQVFISYSHLDKTWLTKLQTHLKPLTRKQTLTIWDDTQIQPGDEWRNEIEKALAAAKVAVLLVSPDFLNSDFIDANELPHLLEAAQTEGLTIIWVPIRYSLYEETPIKDYQAAHSPAQPLNSLSESDQDKAWVKICKDIKAAVNG